MKKEANNSYKKLIEIYDREERDSDAKKLFSKVYHYISGKPITTLSKITEDIEELLDADEQYTIEKLEIINKSETNEAAERLKISIEMRDNNNNIIKLYLPTTASWYIDSPEKRSYKIDYGYSFTTSKMRKIKEYFDDILLDCKEKLVEVVFEKDCSCDIDFQHNNYTISKHGSAQFGSSISSTISTYDGSRINLRRYLDIRNSLDGLLRFDGGVMEYAGSKLDYTTETIEWRAYSF